MKTIILGVSLVCCFVTLCGCPLKISRTGYTIEDQQTAIQNCNVPIKLKAYKDSRETENLGSVEIYSPNWISDDCDIATILSIVRQDACYLKADLINITEEMHPDYILRECYRVTADFIKYTNASQAKAIESDPQYNWDKIQKEGAFSRERANAAYWGAVGGGLVGGALGGAIGGTAAGK